jgi:hypothetical protein
MLRAIVIVALLASAGVAAAETAFVKSEVANVRSGPSGEFPIENRIYVGQTVTIYERRNGWARISADGYSERWISLSLLGNSKPDTGKGFVLPSELARADLDALSEKPFDNLDGDDVVALRRFGAHVLDTRKCAEIIDGDESVNRVGEIYVLCGNMKKQYAKKADWLK